LPNSDISKKPIIVIGGVAAGMTAASRARRLKPDAEIFVFEKSGNVSYGSCGLPYFVSDVIKSPEDLVVYEALYDNEVSKIWVRPLAMFLEEVEVEGKKQPRFKYLGKE